MLKLSAKGDYGLMFLKHLAELAPGQYATVGSVAEARKLPVKYLERVAGALAGAGILVSREGQGGGYRLAHKPEVLKLVDVLEILEGELEPVHCTHDDRCCERKGACERKTGWQTVHNKLYDILSQHTLADLLQTIQP